MIQRCVESWCGRFVAKNRNFCDKHAEPCWCPCRCGCKEPDAVVNSSGLCPDCEDGNHEVPPKGFWTGVEELLKLHESIVEQYRQVLKDRSVGAQRQCYCRQKNCVHTNYDNEMPAT